MRIMNKIQLINQKFKIRSRIYNKSYIELSKIVDHIRENKTLRFATNHFWTIRLIEKRMQKLKGKEEKKKNMRMPRKIYTKDDYEQAYSVLFNIKDENSPSYVSKTLDWLGTMIEKKEAKYICAKCEAITPNGIFCKKCQKG